MAEKRKLSASEGWLGILLRVLHVVIGIVGLICSIVVLGDCEFFKYTPTPPPDGVDDNRKPDFITVNNATVGLFRYNPNNIGCSEISDDFDSLSGYFTAAQVGGYIGAILGIVGAILIVLEITCCRYPFSRCLISSAFFVAFVGQALTFFVYVAPVCDPNFKNGPFPCSASRSTWISTAACVLFFLACCLACCLPKPVPLILRMKEASKDKEENDGWCAFCAKKPVEEEEGEEEEATADEEEEEEVKAKGGVVMVPSAEDIEEQLAEEQAALAAAATLAAVRRAKHEEIEKQLALLDKYKDTYSEEEYSEKVGVLLAALPDPNTFDAYTKTEIPAPPPEEPAVVDMEQGLTGENEEEEEVQKKNVFQKVSAGVGAGYSKTKNAVTGGKKKEKQEEGTEFVLEESSVEVDA